MEGNRRNNEKMVRYIENLAVFESLKIRKSIIYSMC